jgi:hypothetical protein
MEYGMQCNAMEYGMLFLFDIYSNIIYRNNLNE